MNNLNKMNLIEKTSRAVLIGLSITVLTLGIVAFAKGELFKQGPSIAVADENDAGGTDSGGNGSDGGGSQDCCDNNSNVDNSNNSDNGSNQNNSQDNQDNGAPTPTPTPTQNPTPTPVATPAPTVNLGVITDMCVNRPGADDNQITLKFSSSRSDVLNYGLYENGVNVGGTTGNNPYFDLFLTPGQTRTFTATVQVPEGTFGHSAPVTVTGKNCSTPTPTPTPTPKPSKSPQPSPTPTPKPSATPSSVQCPVGKIGKIVDSTVVCVAQNQTQNQTQTQNNNQNQTVNQNVTATGGNSSSSSSSSSSVSLTINNPTPTPTPSTTTVTVVNTVTPQVVMQTKGDVKELPKTGLPLAALALGGLLPAGFGIKRFGKKDQVEENASSIWTERQMKG